MKNLFFYYLFYFIIWINWNWN